MDDLRLESLEVNSVQHAHRLHHIEECFDTLRSPVWKRVLFRVDGWPPWYVVAEKPAWRPWRRFYTS